MVGRLGVLCYGLLSAFGLLGLVITEVIGDGLMTLVLCY